jgi:hypothetical protein
VAVRLEGRVIQAEAGWNHRPIQTCYYVESFVGLHPENRSDVQRATTVQFYGKGYRRQWNVNLAAYPNIWDELETPDYFLVDIRDINRVLNMDDSGHPFDEDDL